jgi:hypothetical protein
MQNSHWPGPVKPPTSEYLLVMTEPTASMTDAEVKFSDGISSRPLR